MPSFGQIVIGPPGSGKSTFCAGMCEFLTSLGRKVAVVNLDPANDSLSYNCAVDISTLITLNDVMENLKLGPNGGLIYCIEYLEKNIDWLEKKLKELKGYYFLFDCPGQVELYTHHTSVRNVVRQLEKWDFRVSETREGPHPYLFFRRCSLCSPLNGVDYTCQLFLRYKREIFILGVKAWECWNF